MPILHAKAQLGLRRCRQELEAAQAKHQRTLQKCDLLDRGIAGKRAKLADLEASEARMKEASSRLLPLHV